ncbi:hypothetical protein FOL47_003144, partial [Perkinsus chesapeaki]
PEVLEPTERKEQHTLDRTDNCQLAPDDGYSTAVRQVPASPKLTHMRSRSRPAAGMVRTDQPSTEGIKVVKQTAPLESLAVETQRFGSRLREGSRTRWTGRPTVPTSPHLHQVHARAWPLGGPNNVTSVAAKENRPEVLNSLKEE